MPKDDEHHSLLKRYEILTGHPQTLIESYDPLVREYPSSKILIMTDSADEIISEVRRSLNCAEELTIFRGSPDPFFVEVLRKNVTKGHGLARLCEMLAVDMQEVVAFGDGENDREMLQFVGWGCAPSNAKADAKAAARKVLQVSQSIPRPCPSPLTGRSAALESRGRRGPGAGRDAGERTLPPALISAAQQ